MTTGRKPAIDAALMRQIDQMYVGGASQREIGLHFGISQAVIGRALHRQGAYSAYVPNTDVAKRLAAANEGTHLTEDQVIEIKRKLSMGARPSDLAATFKVSRALVWRISNGTRWAAKKRNIKQSEHPLAKRLSELGLNMSEASVLCECSTAVVSRWLRGAPPSERVAKKIAEGLDTTVEALGWKPAARGARDRLDGVDRRARRASAKRAIALQVLAKVDPKRVDVFLRRMESYDEITLRLPPASIPTQEREWHRLVDSK